MPELFPKSPATVRPPPVSLPVSLLVVSSTFWPTPSYERSPTMGKVSSSTSAPLPTVTTWESCRSTTLLPPRCCSVPSHPTTGRAGRGRARPRMAARPTGRNCADGRRQRPGRSGRARRLRRRLVSRVGLGDRVLSEVPRLRSNPRLPAARPRAASAPPDVPPVLVGAVLWLEGVLRGEASSCADLRATSGTARRVTHWDRLRRLVVGGTWPDLCLTTEEAAWLDDGAFSRWVMGQCRPLPSCSPGCGECSTRPTLAGSIGWFAGSPDGANHEPSLARRGHPPSAIDLGGAPHDARVVLIPCAASPSSSGGARSCRRDTFGCTAPTRRGKKIPEHVRQSTARRIEAFAVEHFAGRTGCGTPSLPAPLQWRPGSLDVAFYSYQRPAATNRRCCSPATTTARPRGVRRLCRGVPDAVALRRRGARRLLPRVRGGGLHR